MIWFTVLRSYKDAHAKKIVQRILNGTDKDKLLETVVQLETEQQFQAIWKSGCRDFGQTWTTHRLLLDWENSSLSHKNTLWRCVTAQIGSMPHDRARRKNSVTGVFFTSYFGKYVQSYAACFLAIVTKIGKKRKILIKSGFFVLK